MPVLLYDYRWNSENQIEFQASNGGRFGRKTLTFNDPLSVRVCGETRCAGSMRDHVWQPCPQQIAGRKKCETCRNREGNFIYTSFDGFNTDIFTPDDLARLEGEHLVYLALFDQTVSKIGVCKKERHILRQVEQGSHHTLYIAETPNGVLARQIETCFRQAGVADKIQASTKKNFILPEITASQGEATLKKLLSSHQNAFKNHPELQKFMLAQPNFKDWTQTFHLNSVLANPKILHTVKLGQGESVSGTIIALKGSFIILETNEEMVTLCTKDLQGLTLDFTPAPSGLNLNSALQNTLF